MFIDLNFWSAFTPSFVILQNTPFHIKADFSPFCPLLKKHFILCFVPVMSLVYYTLTSVKYAAKFIPSIPEELKFRRFSFPISSSRMILLRFIWICSILSATSSVYWEGNKIKHRNSLHPVHIPLLPRPAAQSILLLLTHHFHEEAYIDFCLDHFNSTNFGRIHQVMFFPSLQHPHSLAMPCSNLPMHLSYQWITCLPLRFKQASPNRY